MTHDDLLLYVICVATVVYIEDRWLLLGVIIVGIVGYIAYIKRKMPDD